MGRFPAFVAVLAMVVAACGDAADPPATSASSPVVSSTVGATSTVVPAVTTGPTTTVVAPTTTSDGGGPAAGPPPYDTWTVILASLPFDEFTRDDAHQRLAELSASADGGVLVSNDYPSLNPGFWVVYDGVFERDFQAIEHCQGLQVECYHRYLGGAPDVAPVRENGQALLWLESRFGLDLVAVSLATGDAVRTVVPDRGGGEFPGQPSIHPNGVEAVLHIGFEDSWFSCEATVGNTFRVDLKRGSVEDFGMGFSPLYSPGGRYLAWIEAPGCLEDPEEPLFFIAFHDTVVVRDLATGSERRWRPGPGLAGTADGVVLGVGWAADGEHLFFSLEDGLRELPVAAPTSQALETLALVPVQGYEPGVTVVPLGELASGELAVRWSSFDEQDGFSGGIDLYDVDVAERTPLLDGDGWMVAAFDRSHGSLAYSDGTRLRSVGEVELDVDVGRQVVGIGW